MAHSFARPPIRDGLMLTILGANGSLSMSAIEWIGGVPGDPVVVRRQHLRGRRVDDVGVLEPGIRERLDDPLVEDRIGRLIDDRAAVERLEVDRVDGARDARGPSISSGVHELVASSLKRSVGSSARRSCTGSSVGGSPSRSEQT